MGFKGKKIKKYNKIKMGGEYVPPSLRSSNNNLIKKEEEENVDRFEPKENSKIKKGGLIGIEDEGNVYIPTVLIKEKEINLERDFPVLGGVTNNSKSSNNSVWGNIQSIERIKDDIQGVQIKSDRVIDIRPEKKLKAVYYDEEIEEIVDKKIEASRLKRDMELGIVEYSQEERIYIYKEKDDRARVAFYDPEGFDKILEEESEIENNLYEDEYEEEYSDSDSY